MLLTNNFLQSLVMADNYKLNSKNRTFSVISIRFCIASILGLQPRDKAAMLGVKTKNFSRRIHKKIAFSSQRREMLLFSTINMAAVTSRANQQYGVKGANECCSYIVFISINRAWFTVY